MTSRLKLTIDLAAQIEIEDAIDWYDSARVGLGYLNIQTFLR